MTTPAAPNSISMSQIATEAGIPTTNADLNNSSIRTLAGLTGDRTTISFSDLRGKSSFSAHLCMFTGETYGYCAAYTGSKVATGARFVSIVIVGGGGGGGASGPSFGDGGGGGGAGGVGVSPKIAVTPGACFSFSIGAGGSGAQCGGRGASGGTTSFTINGVTYSVLGGGGGGGASPGSHQQAGLSGANGGGSSGTNVNIDPYSGSKVYPPSAGCCGVQINGIPGGAGSASTLPATWGYGGGYDGGTSLDNGLNGGGGGADRIGANAFDTVPTGGPGITPPLQGYTGTLPELAGGGGAGGTFTNCQNADPNCVASNYFMGGGGCYNSVITSQRLDPAPGGGGQGGIGVDANGSRRDTAGTCGSKPGAGGGGGGGYNPTGGDGAGGIIYAWFSNS